MADLASQLNTYFKGSPLQGLGKDFVQIGKKYGVHPGVFAILAKKESSLGTAGYATQGTHNPYGWGIHEGLRYPTWTAATEALAKGLSGSLYKGAGLKSLGQIIPKYAPPSENATGQYIQQVNQWGQQFGIQPGQSIFGFTGAGQPGVVATPPATAPRTTAGGTTGAGGGTTGAAPAVPGVYQAPRIDFARLSSILAQSRQAALAGNYGTGQDWLSKMLATIAPGSVQPGSSAAPTAASPQDLRPQGGPAPGQMGGARYAGILGKRGKIIGTPYAGTHTLGNWESDDAVDISVPVGTPVYAPKAGVIGSQIGPLNSSNPRMAGSRLHLKMAGNELYYAHLSRIVVKAGQRVKAGQLLGYTGSANGVAHLHLGSKNGDPRKLYAFG